jgi:hypothetical protein
MRGSTTSTTPVIGDPALADTIALARRIARELEELGLAQVYAVRVQSPTEVALGGLGGSWTLSRGRLPPTWAVLSNGRLLTRRAGEAQVVDWIRQAIADELAQAREAA